MGRGSTGCEPGSAQETPARVGGKHGSGGGAPLGPHSRPVCPGPRAALGWACAVYPGEPPQSWQGGPSPEPLNPMAGRQRRCPLSSPGRGHPGADRPPQLHSGGEQAPGRGAFHRVPHPIQGALKSPPTVPSPQTVALDYLGHGVLCRQLPMCRGGSTPPSATHVEAEARRDTEPGPDPQPPAPPEPAGPRLHCPARPEAARSQPPLTRPGPGPSPGGPLGTPGSNHPSPAAQPFGGPAL